MRYCQRMVQPRQGTFEQWRSCHSPWLATTLRLFNWIPKMQRLCTVLLSLQSFTSELAPTLRPSGTHQTGSSSLATWPLLQRTCTSIVLEGTHSTLDMRIQSLIITIRNSIERYWINQVARRTLDGEETEPPPPCVPEVFRCFGKASRASLTGIARHLRVRGE